MRTVAVAAAGRQAQAQNQRQQNTCKLFPIFHVRFLLF
jgi:hypothetical protein